MTDFPTYVKKGRPLTIFANRKFKLGDVVRFKRKFYKNPNKFLSNDTKESIEFFLKDPILVIDYIVPDGKKVFIIRKGDDRFNAETLRFCTHIDSLTKYKNYDS